MGLCLAHLDIPKARRSGRLGGRWLGGAFSADPLSTVQPEPCCAHAPALLLAPHPFLLPFSSPSPLDAWVLGLFCPRLLLHPPLPRIRKGHFVGTHLSSLSDMTPAPQRPGSAPRTRAEADDQPPPRVATRALYACAVTPMQSLPGAGQRGKCARAPRS